MVLYMYMQYIQKLQKPQFAILFPEPGSSWDAHTRFDIVKHGPE